MAEEGRMKAIVIFDSKYGNCEKVAEDIAAGLAEAGAEVNIDMRDVPLEGKVVGFFDTYGVAKQPGNGAGYLTELAKEHPGGAKIVEPELSVLVTGMKGPLEDGAMDKAREFGKKLAEAAD